MDSDAVNLKAPELTTNRKTIAICADDYGVDVEVNRAIVDLAGLDRLTATSVLVDADIDSESIAALKSLNIDIGLHLNFTEVLGHLPVNAVMPLNQLIMRSHARLLSSQWVRQNIERQLDQFEALLGRAPNYVDGHLHIHQLPMIRDELLKALSMRQLPAGFWVRDTRAGDLSGAPWAERFKAAVIGNLGMSALARAAHDQRLGVNQGFFGVYDFTKAHRPFMQMMAGWLAHARSGSLVMTHPSCHCLPGDPIGQARVDEYRALASEAFGSLLQQQGVTLARASQALSSLP
ncbi:MAG: ChbG/HpnK family deacetylase [Burkholderiaceae bacterium]|nr:ChbG/HpnK family deacetylase [Burkholderiaceae bacterium]